MLVWDFRGRKPFTQTQKADVAAGRLAGPSVTGTQGFPVGHTPSDETVLLCSSFSFWSRSSVHTPFRPLAGTSTAFPESLFLKNNPFKIIIFWGGHRRSPEPSFTLLLNASPSLAFLWIRPGSFSLPVMRAFPLPDNRCLL